MPLRLPLSYRSQLFLALTVVAAVTQCFVVYAILSTQAASLKSLETGALVREAQTLTGRLAQPLTQENSEALSGTPAPLSLREEIRAAEVLDDEGRLRAYIGSEAPPTAGTALNVPITIDDAGAEQVVGQLSPISASNDVAEAAAMLRERVLGGAFSVLLVQMVLLWVVTGRVSDPLVRLLETIRRIHRGQLEDRVPHLDHPGEIGEVARALDAFRLDAIDVRAMRTSAARRNESERKGIQRALDAAGGALLILDEDQNVVFANDRAAHFTGLDVGLDALVDRIVDEPARTRLREAVAQGQVFSSAAELVRADGAVQGPDRVDLLPEDPLPVRLRSNPIRADDGTALGNVILITDATEEARVASRIRRLAEHDTLTGLHNRQVLEDRIDAALAGGARDLTLLMLDLDRFKSINDTLGHGVGDALLVHVADQLRLLTRRTGLTVRLGGDEFAILIRGADAPAEAQDLAETIVAALEKPQLVDQRQLLTGASIGIASIDSARATLKDILRMADLALYEAKRQGRSRFIVFESALAESTARKSEVETALRRALREREISAHFQQQCALPDRHLTGFEALARWTSPALGPVSPAEFIPIAEESGLIAPLTRHMIENAAHTAAGWRKAGFAGRISVNVSPKLFAEDVVEFVQDALLAGACPADALEIEITEAVFLDQGDRALRQIERLRALGVTVALDDFGMGYSSLGYLQRFPVDKIKIDRAFVSRMQRSDVTRAIVKAIVEMGHALGMTVTAEGAETEEDVARLIGAGVDTVQGFVDGRPMAREAADELISNQRPRAATG